MRNEGSVPSYPMKSKFEVIRKSVAVVASLLLLSQHHLPLSHHCLLIN